MDNNSSSINNIQLQELVKQHFSLDELKELCFILGINFESIPGENTIDSKSRELIMYMSRQGNLDTLIAGLRKQRPNVNWPDAEQNNSATHTNMDGKRPSTNNQTVNPNLDQTRYSDEQVRSTNDTVGKHWTHMLQAALDMWDSNTIPINSLSRTTGQTAALGAAITVIGTLISLAYTDDQVEYNIFQFTLSSMLFAGAAFVLSQFWVRMLIFVNFVLGQVFIPFRVAALTAIGGITGYFIFFTMVQTFVYSWVPGAIAGMALAGLGQLNLRRMWKPNWTVPILAAVSTMLICYTALFFAEEAVWTNAFGVFTSGLFVAVFVHKLFELEFIVPSRND